MTTIPQIPWQDWMQRYERQEQSHVPDREARFSVMLDVVETLMPQRFVALDLACGPGSMSQRLLARFPQARCVALDADPVLLLLGQQVFGEMQGRLRWVEADLRNLSWLTHLGEEQVDAVLSTTALHWLPPEALVQVYHQLGRLVRPGGVVLNGDHLGFVAHLPSFQKIAERLQARDTAWVRNDPQGEDWETWWQALRQESGLEAFFAERERRFIDRTHHGALALVELHEAALRNAGFREVGVIWQHADNRVLLAVR